MAKAGKKYPLLIYTRMMDRWWPAIFFIGIGVIALGWPPYSDLYTRLTDPFQWELPAALGGIVILVSLVMLAMRKSAYVQPFGDHFLLATPLLRMNISYRRINRYTPVSMATLFPPAQMSGLRRDIVEPLWKYTAVVIELNALPIPRSTLRFFLSPFFFKDQTPHLVILVKDWMAFSTQLESMRVSGNAPTTQARKKNSSLLQKLPDK